MKALGIPHEQADRCPTCHGPKHPRIVLQAQHVDAPRAERWTPQKVLGVSIFAVIFVYMLAVVMTGMAVPA